MLKRTEVLVLVAVLSGCGGGPSGEGDAEGGTSAVSESATPTSTQAPELCGSDCNVMEAAILGTDACLDAGGSLCLDYLTDEYTAAQKLIEKYGPTLTGGLNEALVAADTATSMKCYERPPDDEACLNVIKVAHGFFVDGLESLLNLL